jgi:hypothetical protein
MTPSLQAYTQMRQTGSNPDTTQAPELDEHQRVETEVESEVKAASSKR